MRAKKKTTLLLILLLLLLQKMRDAGGTRRSTESTRRTPRVSRPDTLIRRFRTLSKGGGGFHSAVHIRWRLPRESSRFDAHEGTRKTNTNAPAHRPTAKRRTRPTWPSCRPRPTKASRTLLENGPTPQWLWEELVLSLSLSHSPRRANQLLLPAPISLVQNRFLNSKI